MAPEAPEDIAISDSRLKELIEFLAKGLVEHPEEVSVTAIEGQSSVIFELRVAADDMGKIIGKEGRVAKAMRTLLKVAAAREHRRAILEIV
ncbi:MAG: KH domain-containing protein [Chloroflexi bacterium]|nr:KH domain-containing protein [Chloroflexota bacterium]